MTALNAPRYRQSGGNPSSFRDEYPRDALPLTPDWTDALMRTVRVGSAGAVILVVGYAPYLPSVGTSPAVASSRPHPLRKERVAVLRVSAPRSVIALSAAAQARELLASLSMNKSQLAEVLRVSRPTIYEWLDGKEPNPANAERLVTLLTALADVGVTSKSPLHPRFVRQSLAEGTPSLFDLLRRDKLDEVAIRALARDAKVLVGRTESRRLDREERLRAIGFDEPSDEQRREQLARNVAMRAWPKT